MYTTEKRHDYDGIKSKTKKISAAPAVRKLIDNEIDCLPVVRDVDNGSRNFEVTGRITKTNLTRLLMDLAEGKGDNYYK